MKGLLWWGEDEAKERKLSRPKSLNRGCFPQLKWRRVELAVSEYYSLISNRLTFVTF